MNSEKFNEIIDFAIKGEKEAIEFYRDLQTRVKFKAQKVLLKEYEKMEEGHVIVLENMRKKEFKNVTLKKVQDLRISNYLVDKEFSEDMDYQDILIIAMKKEEAAANLYRDLATKVDDKESEKLFLRLAQEETEHKLKFETLYDDEILKEN